MCHLINAELILIAISCQTRICSHHPGITEEDIKSLGFGEELSDGIFDGRKRGVIAFEEGKLERWISGSTLCLCFRNDVGRGR